METIKEAFSNVKKDIDFLREELEFLKISLNENKLFISDLGDLIQNLNNQLINVEKNQEKIKTDISTIRQENQAIKTDISTHSTHFKLGNSKNLGISNGNQGVSTDRQTDRQTDEYTYFAHKNKENLVDNASEILDSLDNIKKELRLKFKRLTEQEFLVFSAIYQFEEEMGHSDYKMLSNKLNLSESSIRDYVSRIIIKGIPVDKIKVNNKNIHLKISQNLRKMTSLSTILHLREI